MAHTYRLDKDVRTQLDALRDQLAELGVEVEKVSGSIREDHDAHQEVFEQATEKWQDGDRGTEVAEWISNLDGLGDELDELGALLDSLGVTIGDLPDKPGQ